MLFNWKKKYFKNKLISVQRMIADLEFKRFKTQEIREEVRLELSNKQAALESLVKNIESQKKTPTLEEGEIKRLDDQRVLLDRDIERHRGQIKELDIEVDGAAKSTEYPDGVQGINQQIDALQELVGMLKSYIKNEI